MESFSPPFLKILIPLSWYGLWEAETTIPAPVSLSARHRYATPGVGMTSASFTSIPVDATPAARADSSISPEIRVSFPIIIALNPFCFEKSPTAWPIFRASSQVIGYWLATPLIPSVPKSFPIVFFLSY